ncbi:hypothetical protein EDD86DRAFT_227980 [Gorgonomyces haynaldii]|nr:hypothetical protein EDD86DRAFT_227980 [Gorgonomyces haynaldii]
MAFFKQFLEIRGKEIASHPQLMQYYALPYIPDPKQHPSFSELFTDEWHIQIRETLDRVLDRIGTKKPELFEILTRPTEPLVDLTQVHQLQRQLQDLTLLQQQTQTKLKNCQAGYHQVITVAAELVQTLASSVSGQKISPTYLADIVKRLSQLRKNPAEIKTEITKQAVIPPVDVKPLVGRLDYEKIKMDLRQSPLESSLVKKQAYLIQSLRQLLMKAPSGQDRRKELQVLIERDVLDLRTNKKSISAHLLSSQSEIVREQMARLLNVMATDCIGREYLLYNSSHLVGDMVHALKLDKTDTPFRQNILGALQKLSLRRNAQSAMNDLQMVSYLVDILQDLEDLSEYSIEYGAALLMNLCLRSKGKQEACQNPPKILKTLNQLIEHDNSQVKTYVNGCLYSLFSDEYIREEGKKIGMEEQLMYMKQFSDEQLSKQIDFVIEKLNSEEPDEDLEDNLSEDGEEADTHDEDDEQEFMTMEDDSDLRPTSQYKSGEQLLREEYSWMRTPPSEKKIALAAETQVLPAIQKKKVEEFEIGFSSRPKVARTPLSGSIEHLDQQTVNVQ